MLLPASRCHRIGAMWKISIKLTALPVGATTSLTDGGKGTRLQGHRARSLGTARTAASVRAPEAGCASRALKRPNPAVAPGQVLLGERRGHGGPPDPQRQGVVPGGVGRVGYPQVAAVGATPEEVTEGRWLRHAATTVGEVR
eukprot:5067134-Alexandrium_andersonii.AAC.1